MPLFHTPARFRNADPEPGGGGTTTFTQAQLDEAVRAALERETGGLKAKNSELLGKLAEFKGADAATVRKILAAIGDSEEAEMIKAGNIEGVVDRRVTAMRTAHEQELAAVRTRAEALGKQAVRAAVAASAAKSGALPETIDYLVLQAEAEGWSVDDAGNVVQRKGTETVFGKDGRTPLAPSDWVEQVRTKSPFFWPKASGAGATGGDAAQGGKAFKDMSEAERVALHRSNPEEFRRQAAAQQATT